LSARFAGQGKEDLAPSCLFRITTLLFPRPPRPLVVKTGPLRGSGYFRLISLFRGDHKMVFYPQGGRFALFVDGAKNLTEPPKGCNRLSIITSALLSFRTAKGPSGWAALLYTALAGGTRSFSPLGRFIELGPRHYNGFTVVHKADQGGKTTDGAGAPARQREKTWNPELANRCHGRCRRRSTTFVIFFRRWAISAKWSNSVQRRGRGFGLLPLCRTQAAHGRRRAAHGRGRHFSEAGNGRKSSNP